jgi:transcriptional regulator with XRE-family HTH domain
MATNKNNHVGFSIRILRNLAGLSQAELAEKIGKTRGIVSYIEKQGKVNH